MSRRGEHSAGGGVPGEGAVGAVVLVAAEGEPRAEGHRESEGLGKAGARGAGEGLEKGRVVADGDE